MQLRIQKKAERIQKKAERIQKKAGRIQKKAERILELGGVLSNFTNSFVG